MYKMVVITVQNYANAKLHTIIVGNRQVFWIKMIDVQKGLGLQNMPDSVRNKIQGIYETKNPTKEQKRKYIRTEQEISKKPMDSFKIKYARSGLMVKIIKNCRGVKKGNDGINRKRKTKRKF